MRLQGELFVFYGVISTCIKTDNSLFPSFASQIHFKMNTSTQTRSSLPIVQLLRNFFLHGNSVGSVKPAYPSFPVLINANCCSTFLTCSTFSTCSNMDMPSPSVYCISQLAPHQTLHKVEIYILCSKSWLQKYTNRSNQYSYHQICLQLKWGHLTDITYLIILQADGVADKSVQMINICMNEKNVSDHQLLQQQFLVRNWLKLIAYLGLLYTLDALILASKKFHFQTYQVNQLFLFWLLWFPLHYNII